MLPQGGSGCHRYCLHSRSLCFRGNHWVCWQRVLFCQGVLFFSPCPTSPHSAPWLLVSHMRLLPLSFSRLASPSTVHSIVISHQRSPLLYFCLSPSLPHPPLSISLSGRLWHRQIPLTLPVICPNYDKHGGHTKEKACISLSSYLLFSVTEEVLFLLMLCDKTSQRWKRNKSHCQIKWQIDRMMFPGVQCVIFILCLVL